MVVLWQNIQHSCSLPSLGEFLLAFGPAAWAHHPGPPPRALSPLAHPPTPPFSNLNFTPLSCLKIRRRGGGVEGDHLCRCLGPSWAPFPGPFPRAHLPTPPFSNLNFTLLSCLKIRRRSGGRPPLPAAQGGSLWGGFFQGGCCVDQLFMLLSFLMESLLRSGYQPPISCQLSGWIFPHSAPFRLMLSSCPNQLLNSWKAISCLFPEGSSPNFLMERTFLGASSCGSAFARLVGEAFPEGSSLF